MTLFKGSGVALVTPFRDGQVDFEKLGELIEWHIESNTDAIIVCGTTGEASTMTKEEKKATIDFAVKKSRDRIPIIAGTGSNNTADALELSLYANSVNAHGLLLVTPYYNKTSQRGLIQYFTSIADKVDIPIILYNVPGRTGLNLLPSTVLRLSEHPNIVGIKEASGDISQIAEIARLCPENFYIYSGNDDHIVAVLSLGGQGVISVVANILPKETHNLVCNFLEGRVKESTKIQHNINGLVKALFIEVNPIPVKTAMNLLGMEVGNLRLPLVEMEPNNRKILIDNLQGLGMEVSND